MKNLVLKRAEGVISRININNSVSVVREMNNTENEFEHFVLENDHALIFHLVNGQRSIDQIITEVTQVKSESDKVKLLLLIKELILKEILATNE